MTEEQFWRSNPRIMKVWEKIWKDEIEDENQRIHLYVGHYMVSALSATLNAHVTNLFAKTPNKVEYVKEPIAIFKPSEEEIEQSRKDSVGWYKAWCDSFIRQYSKK